MAWYYTFEAKEIQRFILQSDKLRDMVGGSELVNLLCGDFLEQALEACGLAKPADAIIANAAGWARVLFEEEQQAREYYEIWPLLVSRFAPGIQIVQALLEIRGSLPDVMDAGFKALRAARNLNYPDLPEAGPLVERAPRTGGTAVAFYKEHDDKVLVDSATLRKRASAEGKSLTEKLSNNIDIHLEDWPFELDDIVSDKSAYIAIIHADGNDLGTSLMRINEHLKGDAQEARAIYRGFSDAIEETTVAAVRAACDRTIFADHERNKKNGTKKKLAARPIVLGGDDLTIIIRADLAVEFTRIFLETFESGSKSILGEHLGRFKIQGCPERITACAGIAFVKKAYPFSAAYHMAETLCDHTKMVAKSERMGSALTCVPSSFTFHRITTSMAEGFGEVKQQELTGRGLYQTEPLKFWYGPYAVGEFAGKLPLLADLEKLRSAIDNLPTGSIRTLIGTLYNDPISAGSDYGRILQVAGEEARTDLNSALIKMTGPSDHPLWNNQNQTPVADAHLLRVITRGGTDENI
jgi:hypothetical protein